MPWYRTGTVSVTNGSVAVVGDQTLWLAQASAGDVFTLDGDKFYEIDSVTDDTHLVLKSAYLGADGTAQSYAIIRNFTSTLPAQLAAKLATLMSDYHVTLDELTAWLAGTGTVTLHDGAGNAYQVKTPAQLATEAGGVLTKNVSGNTDIVLTAEEAANAIIEFTGTLTGAVNVIVPATAHRWIARNSTTGAYALTVKTASGTGLALIAGVPQGIWCDAVNVLRADSDSAKADVDATNAALALKANIDTTNAALALKADLVAGKIPVDQLPAIAITDTYVVNTQTAMLALSAQTGDVAVRSDLNKSFILQGGDPTVLANWQELLTPTDAVLSVFGRTGAVTMLGSDVTAALGFTPRDAASVTDVAHGGTGSATAAGARTNLGAAASGSNADITALTGLVSINGGPIAGMRNRLINANFAIKQRPLSGTITLAAGSYGHDRWKAGASGCTYTYAASGLDTTITISAGSLMQVVEGKNIEGGVYAISHAGTAQARVAVNGAATSGSYATASQATPLLSASATGGQTVTVEFSTGTVSKVMMEPGSTATAFERRPHSLEEAFCYRHCQPIDQIDFEFYGTTSATNLLPIPLIGRMMATPSIMQQPTFSIQNNCSGSSISALNAGLLRLNSNITSNGYTRIGTTGGGLAVSEL
jgi:hypothetical protein